MDKIGKLLLKQMADKGLAGTAVASQICFHANEMADGRFSATSYSRGVLKLSVADSIDAGEVQMESEKIVDCVNKKIGRKIVQRIRIVQGYQNANIKNPHRVS
ncbi:MAG: DciA family protein [Candidatus Berkelbacteria bacterium]|nr:DciA family protein [Candidatus Berkelbacteria bacterium]